MTVDHAIGPIPQNGPPGQRGIFVRKSQQRILEKYDADAAKLKEVKLTISQTEQEITRLAGRIQVATTQREQAQQSREPLIDEANALGRESEKINDRAKNAERDIEDLQAELLNLKTRIEDHESELRMPMARVLSDEEERLIDELSKEVEHRQKSVVRLGRKRNEVSCLELLRSESAHVFQDRKPKKPA